jgi:hypothetical protein
MHSGPRVATLPAMLRAALLAAVIVLLAPAAARADATRIYFTKGEQLAYVTRDLPAGVDAAVKELLKGPPAGYGTTIPAGESYTVSEGAVDFTPDLKYESLAQVVYTLTSAGEEEIEVDGKRYSREDFGPEPFTMPKPPTRKTAAPAKPKAVQTKLASLGYLPDDAVTGKWDYRTMQAVIAFQAWSGLSRDGVVGPMTQAKLDKAGRPLPLDRTSKGKRVEIYRSRGVLLLVNNGRVVRAIHTSTGIGGDSPDIGTPPGTWKIYRKEVKSWSVPYKTWLPYASYWVGGWAIHGYPDVPATPASHGCARVPLPEAKLIYDFVAIGTPVQVI